MKRYITLLLALSCGILLWAAWPVSPLTFLIFIAWVPLLWMETKVKSKRKFFGLVYISMFIWNVATTWWIWNASEIGALMAFLANSFLMCFPWLGFKIVKNKLGENTAFLSLVAFWMCFEFIHLQDWGLSWPWLTLGNVFATHPGWIQWYEYTGTSGGTLWILIVNILLFIYTRNFFIPQRPKMYKHIVAAALFLTIPLLFSLIDGFHIDKKMPGIKPNIVVVQPNIDPYEKIAAGTFEAQLTKLIHLSEQAIDSNTTLVVWPETALYTERGIEEEMMKENPSLISLRDFLQRHPNINLFTGVESYRIYDTKKNVYRQTFSIRFFF